MKAFDLIGSPVNGINLIEASAGTGKTYTITAVFLRLLLEKQISAEQILVVTFTEAATAELKERIRNRLKQAQSYCITGETDDQFIINLIACQQDKKRVLSLLTQAIRSFDQAAIFTIHGFCYRVLNDHAFLTGSMFDAELIADQHEFKQEIIEDFWRCHIYTESDLFVNFVLDKTHGPENLIVFNDSIFSHENITIIPKNKRQDTSQLQAQFRKNFDSIAASWKKNRSEIENIFVHSDQLKRNVYRIASIPLLINKMDIFVRSSGSSPFLFDGFDKFTQNTITHNTKEKFKHNPPAHSFFDLCEALQENQKILIHAFETNLTFLKIELIEYLRMQLAIRKKEKNILSFDDLLQNLNHVLNNADSQDLIRSLRQHYKAALIDEFQDTDSIQYNIFKKIFDSKHHTLFLIGDPKQAIYGFRGADIFTYITAVKNTNSQYTLSQNWRSDGALVNAINFVFNNVSSPFVFSEIGFTPVRPALKRGDIPLLVNGKDTPSLKIWYLPAENKKPVSKTLAREKIVLAVSAEISHLLQSSQNDKAMLGKRKLQQGDIAVLVRRNSEAVLMQQALGELNVKSVICNNGNIFDSIEAFEIERVLRGILSPNKESALKSALTTQMIGYNGNKLFSIIQEESRYEEIRERFRLYRQLWHSHGFIRMFNYFMQKEDILSKLTIFPDGERRCTNIRHLTDLLHETNMQEHPGMEELVNWLSRQRNPDRPQMEQHQLRLESDENAVKIVTIHKSKGLEYDIVFCPFMWDSSKVNSRSDYFSFHDKNNSEQLVLDFGSEETAENVKLAEREILAENMRLLYVALTRAKSRCYLVFGNINEAETSALAFIFNEFGNKEDVYESIRNFALQADGDISVTLLPSEENRIYVQSKIDIPELKCRRFIGNIQRDWQFSSFTALVQNRSSVAGIREDNENNKMSNDDAFYATLSPIIDQELSIFNFPKGATSGTCLHDIFEHLDFTNNNVLYQQQLVAEKLRTYGFDIKWQQTITHMIQCVLKSPLNETDPAFTLSSVSTSHRITELEFYFPIHQITSELFKTVLASSKDPCASREFCNRLELLNTDTINGFFKGFVDLVFQYNDQFYILDWKSNFLGIQYENYAPEALIPVMENDFYILQYLIYTIAVNRYLEYRDPSYDYETRFGGIYYMFLRGIDPEAAPGCGIYRHKPNKELIQKLSDVLMDKRTL